METLLQEYNYLSTLISMTSITVNTVPITTETTDFCTIATFDLNLPPSVTLEGCSFLSYLEPKTPNDSNEQGFGYSIRLVNVTSNQIVGVGDFTNSIDTKNVFAITTGDGMGSFEVQAKRYKNFGTSVKVRNFTISYSDTSSELAQL